jgi:hypothetical protein
MIKPSDSVKASGQETTTGQVRGNTNTKRTGELSEAAFLLKAVGLGFKVTRPWGDSERYDFIVDAGGRLLRVQIKCTAALRARGYHIQPIHFVYGKSKVVYTAQEIDFLVAHIVPLDVWYVVPVEAIAAGTSLRLYPDYDCKQARFEQYKEAWHLFGGGAGAATASDPEAVGDPMEKEEPIREPLIKWNPVWKPWIFRGR